MRIRHPLSQFLLHVPPPPGRRFGPRLRTLRGTFTRKRAKPPLLTLVQPGARRLSNNIPYTKDTGAVLRGLRYDLRRVGVPVALLERFAPRPSLLRRLWAARFSILLVLCLLYGWFERIPSQ